MTRAIQSLVGISGLAAAIYLMFLHQASSTVVGLDRLGGFPNYGPMFGIAIAVLSVMTLWQSICERRTARSRS